MAHCKDFETLSRRERDVMYIIHRLEEVTAESLQEEMEVDFTCAAARRYLSILHEKGFLMQRKDAGRCFYRTVSDRQEVGLQLLRNTFRNFFGGSATLGMASFLREEVGGSLDKELEELEQLLRDPLPPSERKP